MSQSLVRPRPATAVFIAVSLGLIAFVPNGAGAQQGQNPGAIMEAATSKAPTLATMSELAGTWACTSMPGSGSYEAVAAVSPQRNAFTIWSPKRQSVFTSPGDVLQLRRSDAGGEVTPYGLAGYVPHAIDLTFESTLPSERAGTTPENTFAHSLEIKRYRSGFVITKTSPNFGTITETCKARYRTMLAPPAMPSPAIVAAAATPAPCPTFAQGLVALGIDQSQLVTVEQSQSFLLAMRGGGGESFLTPYRMRVTPAGPIVTYVRAFSISDVTFANADRAPGTPLVADGPTTQYFLFTATGVGTTTVTFDELQIGKTTPPYATKTYTIVVKPATLIC
jgi:hypothetical protein